MNKNTRKSWLDEFPAPEHENTAPAVVAKTAWDSTDSGSNHGVDDDLHSLVQSLHADYGHFVRTRDAGAQVRAEAHSAGTRRPAAQRGREDLPLVMRSISLGVPVLVTSTDSDTAFRDGLITGEQFMSGLAVPVWQDGQIIGALAVYGSLPGNIGEESVAAVSEMARHLGKSFREDGRRRAFWTEVEVLGFLTEAARTMNTSLAHEEVYPEIARQLSRFVHFDRFSVTMLENERWQVRLKHVIPQAGADSPEGAAVPIVNTIVPDILQKNTGTVLRVDHTNEAACRVLGVSNARSAGIRSLLISPVWWQGEVVGSLNLGSTERDAYTQAQVNLVDRVVDVISGAVVNIGLHEQFQHRAEVSETLAEIGRIASSSHEPEEVMERVCDHIKRLIPFDRIDLNAVDMATGAATRLYFSGHEVQSMFTGQKMKIGPVAAKSLMRRQAVIRSIGSIYPEDGPDPFHQESLARAGLVTVLATPAVARDEPVGELVLRSLRRDAYGPADADLAMRIAQMLAGILDNARLRTSVEMDTQAQYISSRIMGAIASSDGIAPLLTEACDALAGHTPVNQMELFLDALVPGQAAGRVSVSAAARDARPLPMCEMKPGLNDFDVATLARLSSAYDVSASSRRQGHGVIWLDAERHPWIGFMVNVGAERVGSLWIHWAASDTVLRKNEETLSRAGQLLSSAISNEFISERFRAASRAASVSEEITLSLAPSLSRNALLQAFESWALGKMPVESMAVFAMGGDAHSAPEAVYSYGCKKPFEQQRPEIVQKLEALEADDEAGETRHNSAARPVTLRSRLSLSPAHEYIALASDETGSRAGIYLRFKPQSPAPSSRSWTDSQVAAWARMLLPVAGRWTPASPADAVSAQASPSTGIRWRSTSEPDALFTPQEIKTLLKVAEGYSNEEIGQQLHLSPGTVKNRLGNIYKRLGVTSRTSAVAAAIKAGYIEMSDS